MQSYFGFTSTDREQLMHKYKNSNSRTRHFGKQRANTTCQICTSLFLTKGTSDMQRITRVHSVTCIECAGHRATLQTQNFPLTPKHALDDDKKHQELESRWKGEDIMTPWHPPLIQPQDGMLKRKSYRHQPRTNSYSNVKSQIFLPLLHSQDI